MVGALAWPHSEGRRTRALRLDARKRIDGGAVGRTVIGAVALQAEVDDPGSPWRDGHDEHVDGAIHPTGAWRAEAEHLGQVRTEETDEGVRVELRRGAQNRRNVGQRWRRRL